MKPEETFCINEPGVISEVIEGEAIVLNFESGTYYSLNDSYLALWEGIARGVPAGDLPAHLAQRYPGTAADFAGDVEHALRQLLDEPNRAQRLMSRRLTYRMLPMRRQCCRSSRICRNCCCSTPFTIWTKWAILWVAGD